MQTSCLFENIGSGTQIEMVGVTQNNLSPNLLQVPMKNSLYTTNGPHRHKDRGENLSMIGTNYSGTRCAAGIGML